MSYCAIAGAFVLTLFFAWQRYAFQLPPLQKAYMTNYARAGVGSAFHAHQSYRLLYLSGSKVKPRLALRVDFTDGRMALPNGKQMPFTLAELTQAQGYHFPFRGPAEKLADASMYRWLHDAIFDRKSPWRMFVVSLLEGGVCLVLLLALAIPRDIRRFKEMKYGRVLRGPRMLDPTEFNKAQKGDGLGFKTTESGRMMRIPLHKEAQHLQLMGDTGVGKTQLIMQCLRQIRGRGDSAIVYDPACEYIQRF
jgi:hypothetical protein